MITTLADATTFPIFNLAQTFAIDPSLAPNNDAIGITSINVYFKYMPAANTNSSGIHLPGVTLYLANTSYGIPVVTANTLQNFARCEWGQIQTSSDGSVPTNFQFPHPIQVAVGQAYAFILAYDGNEIFTPWQAQNGQYLVTTRQLFSSVSSPLVGQLFEYASPGDPMNNPTSSVTANTGPTNWTPLVGAELTFDIFAARYAIGGVPVAYANTVTAITPIYGNNIDQSWSNTTDIYTITYPSPAMECLAFNFSYSTVQSYIGAQRAFQNCAPYPGTYANGSQSVSVSCNTGSVIVTANTVLPNGTNFNWNTIFPSLTTNIPYIVLQDVSGPNVRRVTQIISNTQIQIDEPPTFTNTISTFLITAVGTIDSTLQSSPYGSIKQMLWLQQSNANTYVKFTGNTILTLVPNNGGTGYNNTDILYVAGYEYVNTALQSSFIAVANIVTNSTGGITTLYISNSGQGFSNAANLSYTVANSSSGNNTSNTSNGSSGTFTATIGATVQTELSTNLFQNCLPMNFNLDDVTPFFQINAPLGTNYYLTLSSLYYAQQNTQTSSGMAFYAANAPQTANVTLSQINPLILANPMAFVSYSNEFYMCYANGATAGLVNASAQYSNSLTLAVNQSLTANNDYVTVRVQSQPSIEYGHYIINNSYAKEYTQSGNAWAKHITTMINFNQPAEDLRVYLTVYQPINTGFQCFAKIQNANDPEQFPLEDWSLLQVVSGAGQVSSLADPTDYVEIGYGFNQFPNANTLLAPTANYTFGNNITTSNASATITCGGGFNNTTVGVPNGSLVRIYNTLFPNTEFFIASVTAVGSDTSLTLDQLVTSNVNIGGNPAFIANNLALDVISLPHQAWNNYNNSNVVRYYNGSQVKYDGYQNLMLKVVFQSSAMSYIPQLNSIRATGVTA